MTTDVTQPGINPKQLLFLLLDNLEALYGGAAGGGKSEAALQGATQHVDDYPVASLLLRRTYTDLDKPGGLMYRAREWFAGTPAHWDGINKRWVFPSGATINFGYMDSENDHLKFQSSEYQYIFFDELSQFPEHQYLYLFSRLRRRRGMPVKLKMRGGTNPGGPGHEWIRRRWNLPHGVEDPSRVFVSATLEDNPFLDEAEYQQSLSQLGEVTYRQLREGDWTAMASGGFFNVRDFRIVGIEDVPRGDEFAAHVRYWDMGATRPSDDNPDPDYTAGLRISRTFIGKENRHMPDWYIWDVKRFREGPAYIEDQLKTAARYDGKGVHQYIEQERRRRRETPSRPLRKQRPPRIQRSGPLYATGDKESRAKIAAARTSEGRVYLVNDERGEVSMDPRLPRRMRHVPHRSPRRPSRRIRQRASPPSNEHSHTCSSAEHNVSAGNRSEQQERKEPGDKKRTDW